MLNCSTSNNHYISETFAPFETLYSSGSKCRGAPHHMEIESCESLIKNIPHKVSERDGLSDLSEGLFDGLCNGESSSEQNVFSTLGSDIGKSEQDLSSILNGIHLGNTLEAIGSGKKVNETNSLSLADLFFKDNKKSNTTTTPSSRNEVMECEFSEQNLFDGLLADCVSSNSDSPYSSLSGDSGFESTEVAPSEPTLSDLFKGVVLTEEQIQPIDKDKKPLSANKPLNFQVDLSVTKKDLPTVSLPNSYQPTPGSSRRENRKSKSPRTKPSLFCRVLCSKPKPINVKSSLKLPSTLPELLSELDYYKYFAFDTPSPDDIIKEKQRHAINKH